MELFLDTAEFDEVKIGVDWGVVTGTTTNPTLVMRAGRDHEETVKRICGIVGNVSAEVTAEAKDEMLAQGRAIAKWHPNVIVKVPMTPDGTAVGKILASEGVRVNVTLCFTVNQALLAAAIGAHIVSPFLGRLDDINEDGMQVVRDIVTAYRAGGIRTKVLAASIRTPLHVTQAAMAGADIATMPFKVLEQMYKHPLTEKGIAQFTADFKAAQAALASKGGAKQDGGGAAKQEKAPARA
ncbi:MAG TPA: transaldolase family protein [Candidatus Limnocylindria bacterium]|nr:transaldolase family protein [Candidatus Limnocylindria bacterium]